MRAPLSTLLLRDGNGSHIQSWSICVLTLHSRGSGTVYFGAILVIQIFAIVSSAVCTFIAVMLFLLIASSCEGRLVLHSLRRLGLFCPSVRTLWKAPTPHQDHSLTCILHSFNVIFLCRFMLNLRGIYLVENAEEESVYPAVSEVHFATVVGNLGAPLDTSIFDTRPLTIDTDGDTAESSSIELSSNPMLVGLRSRPPALDQDHIEMQDADGKFVRHQFFAALADKLISVPPAYKQITSDQNGDGEGGASSHAVDSPHQQRS